MGQAGQAISEFIGGYLLGPILGILNALVVGIVSLAGTLFYYAIDATIVNFTNYFSVIQTGVDSVWILFRDAANIFFVGIFIYIAISILLDRDNFNPQEKITRLVITALLINFSLFFTKIIIDISNIVAIQIYHQVAGNIQNAEIATYILDKSGIASFAKTQSYFDQFMDSIDLGSSAGIISVTIYFLIVFLVSAFLISVFIYGAFLLFVRAIGFVVLMATSSVAFAAKVLPNTNKYWDMWLKHLTNYALFAPVLMLFLYALTIISSGIKGDLADVLKLAQGDFTNPDVMTSLVNSVIIIGILYAAISISSKLSLKGADIASSYAKKFQFGSLRFAGKMITKPATFAVGGVAGYGLRQTEKISGNLADRLRRLNYRTLKSTTIDKALERTQKRLKEKGLINREALRKSKIGPYIHVPKSVKEQEKAKEDKQKMIASFKADELIKKAVKPPEEYKREIQIHTDDAKTKMKAARSNYSVLSGDPQDIARRMSISLQSEERKKTDILHSLNDTLSTLHTAFNREMRKPPAQRDAIKMSNLQKKISETEEMINQANAKIKHIQRMQQKLQNLPANDEEAMSIIENIENDIAKLPSVTSTSLKGIKRAIEMLQSDKEAIVKELKDKKERARAIYGIPSDIESIKQQTIQEVARANKGEVDEGLVESTISKAVSELSKKDKAKLKFKDTSKEVAEAIKQLMEKDSGGAKSNSGNNPQ